MKAESRRLLILVKNNLMIGLVLRAKSIDGMIIEEIDDNLSQRLASNPYIPEVREAVLVEGEDSPQAKYVRKIIRPKKAENEEYTAHIEFMTSIARELCRLVSGNEVLPQMRHVDETTKKRGDDSTSMP